ncbi:MAG TPA: energy transducer TonB [Rhizomicrobium sp.]|nr:energy transducer TonB [Rhizomicrobium sp.]
MRKMIAISIAAAAAVFMAAPAFADYAKAHIDTTQNNQTIYPASSQAAGEEGLVKMKAYVRANGRATRVKIVQSTGYRDLDDAAIQSVMNWRFVPAMENGQPTSDWTELEIGYKLPPEAPKKNNS